MPTSQRPDQPSDLVKAVRAALVDSSGCPSCGVPLTASTCAACGFELTGAAGRRLWELSREAVDALDRRTGHLELMWAEQHQRSAAQATVAAARDTAPVVPAAPIVHARIGPPPPVAPPAPGAPPAPLSTVPPVPRPMAPRPTPPPRAPLRVQTVLQVLGALLLAAACVVFLLFSWGWLSLVGRAAVIGVGTVVVFVAASGLRRARLGSSAEAVGGIGTVMLLLDAWAVHATGLVSPSSGAVYAAAACLVCALLLGAWGRLARIRTGAVTAAVLLPAAPVLLAPRTPGHASWLLLGSMLLASTRFAMRGAPEGDGPRPSEPARPEAGTLPGGVGAGPLTGWSRLARGVLEAAAWLAAGAATVVGLADLLAPRSTPWSPAAALLVLAVLAALQSRWARARNPRSHSAWEHAAGALLAVGAAGVAVASVHEGLPGSPLWACGPVAAAAVTIGLSRSAGRATRGALVVTLLVATPSALMLVSLLAALLVDVRLLPDPLTATSIVVGALALCAATRLTSPWRAARVGGAWTAALVVLVAPAPVLATWPALGSIGLVLLLTAVAALACLADRAGLRLDGSSRAPVRVLVLLAPAVSLIASRDARSAGLALLACAAAAAVARGWATSRVSSRAVVLATSLGLLWSGSVVLLAEPLALGTAATALAVLLLAAVVASVLAPRTPWTRADRGAALGVAAAVSVLAWTWSGLPAHPSALERVTVAALPVAAALAALVVANRGRSALGPGWQVTAAAAWGVLVPASALVVSMAIGGALIGASLPVAATAVAGACVLLAAPLSSGHEDARRATEIAAWAMAGIQVLVAAADVAAEGGAGRLALAVVVASVIAGAWSLRRDRRWARWWALGLGVAATWVLLLHGGVGVPEAYLAPTGVVLLVVALRRRRLGGEDDVPLLVSGLALALVPTALLGGDLPPGDVPRAALALGAGAGLVACGMWGRAHPSLAAPRRDAVLGLAFLVLVLGPVGQGLRAALVGGLAEGHRAVAGLGAVEAWTVPAVALALAALRGLAECAPRSRQAALVAGPWIVAGAATIPSLLAADSSPLGTARWSVVFAAGCALALHGAARGMWRTRDGVAATPVGLVVATVAALVGASSTSSTSAWDIPLALLGLLLVAVVALLLRAGLPSAAPLTSGALLLLPSALHDDPWRMLAALIVGATMAASSTWLRRAPASRVAVLVGSALVVAGPVRHGLTAALSAAAPSVIAVELWTIAAAVVIAGGARALHSLGGQDARAVGRLAPWLLAVVLVLPTALAVDATLAGVMRWTCVMVAGTTMAWWAAWSPRAGVRAAQLVAIGITACTLAAPSALLHGVLPSVELPLVALGGVITGAGALWAARGRTGAAWALAGPLLLASLTLGPAADWRAAVALAAAAALIAVSAMVLMRRVRPSLERGGRAARASAGPLLGAVLLAVAVAARYAAVPAAVRANGATPRLGDVELWSLPSAALLGAALVLAAWRWPFPSAGPRRWGLPLVTAVALAPTLLAVDASGGGSARVLAVLAAGSTLALVAGLRSAGGAARGRAVATGLASASAAALLGAWLAPVPPPDVHLVLLGAVVLTLGVTRLRREPGAGSWSALGIGLALVLAVPFATGWATPTTWRLLLVAGGALVAVVAGAVLRWQAPFLLGGAVLGAVALIQASPAAVAAMRVVEWWTVLAVGGAVLLGLGLTYERRLREAREAVRFVGAMR